MEVSYGDCDVRSCLTADAEVGESICIGDGNRLEDSILTSTDCGGGIVGNDVRGILPPTFGRTGGAPNVFPLPALTGEAGALPLPLPLALPLR